MEALRASDLVDRQPDGRAARPRLFRRPRPRLVRRARRRGHRVEGAVHSLAAASSRGEFRLEAGGDGVALSILEDFVWRTVGDSGVGAHLRPLLDRIAIATPDRIAPHLDELATSFSALVRESREPQPGASVMMGLHLGVVLVGLWRASGLDALGDLRGAGGGTVQRFRQLVELHYRERSRASTNSRACLASRARICTTPARAAPARRRSASSTSG